MRAQISFDLVMEDNMSFVEGTYRLPERDWQVFIFGPDNRVTHPVVRTDGRWESGVTGVPVKWPSGAPLNKAVVLRLLSEQLGVAEWDEVRGPDSMMLR
jgi:hypothetical protein